MREKKAEVLKDKIGENAVWHLYLVRCRDGALYTGISTDVERRFAEHQAGRGSRFLAGRGPLLLALSIPVGDRSRAASLEWLVKRLPSRVKQDLANGKTCLPDLEGRQGRAVKKRTGPRDNATGPIRSG